MTYNWCQCFKQNPSGEVTQIYVILQLPFHELAIHIIIQTSAFGLWHFSWDFEYTILHKIMNDMSFVNESCWMKDESMQIWERDQYFLGDT